MISKVRLQRKFNPKYKFNYSEQFMLIIRIQIVFELLIIFLTCLINFSLDFHFDQIFTCQFWANSQIMHYNLAMTLACVANCPYLIYIEKVRVNLIRDCYFTVILIHTVCGLVNNHRFELDYLIFVCSIGYLASSSTRYLAMVLQQKKLIDEISQIQAEDKKIIKFQQNQMASLTTFQLNDSH